MKTCSFRRPICTFFLLNPDQLPPNNLTKIIYSTAVTNTTVSTWKHLKVRRCPLSSESLIFPSLRVACKHAKNVQDLLSAQKMVFYHLQLSTLNIYILLTEQILKGSMKFKSTWGRNAGCRWNVGRRLDWTRTVFSSVLLRFKSRADADSWIFSWMEEATAIESTDILKTELPCKTQSISTALQICSCNT